MSIFCNISIPGATLDLLKREVAGIKARGTILHQDMLGNVRDDVVLSVEVIEDNEGGHRIALEVEGSGVDMATLSPDHFLISPGTASPLPPAMAFDDSRAQTYSRETFALAIPNGEPTLYLKGSWGTADPETPLSPEVVNFLQKGLDGPPHTDADPDVQGLIATGLVGLGYGAQVMPGPHFTMTGIPDMTSLGDVYGCIPDPATMDDPSGSDALGYRQALQDDTIEAILQLVKEREGFTQKQLDGIGYTLAYICSKKAPIRAYQLTVDDVLPGAIVETSPGALVESVSKPKPGDWMVQQAHGEVMPIKADIWPTLGYKVHG